MTLRSVLVKIAQQEDLNFLLANRIPRRWLTRFVGWLSRVEQPLVRETCLALWRLFGELDLSDARTTRFSSLHECFTRELRHGARRIEPDPTVLVSPCDGILGAMGRIDAAGSVLQAKGFPYTLQDLLYDEEFVRSYLHGSYVTLRLTSGMYHRFHAPYDCLIDQVVYVSGDTWNVNPIALERIEKLFCKNERAVIRCRLQPSDFVVTLVPVAAILVASIRLHFLDVRLHLKYRGPNVMHCDAFLRKGQEMGWFEHGSTIIAFAPEGLSLCDTLRPGSRIRMGEPLLRLPRCTPPGEPKRRD
jgi:phosphatidylserine decarboxylase